MDNGRFVLENKEGKVVRVIHWNNSPVNLIRREDTGRIEAHASLNELESDKVPFTLLAKASKSDVKSHALNIPGYGRLKWVSEVKALDESVKLKEDNTDDYKLMLKWTALAHALLLAFFLVGGYLIKINKVEDERIVTVFKQERKLSPRKIVKASNNKVRRVKRKARKVTRKRVKKYKATSRVARKTKKTGRAKSRVSVSDMGVLGALGGAKKGMKRSRGVRLSGVNGSQGKGKGFKGSGGSYSRALYGKGLVAANIGNGSKVRGNGNYKTRGKGGGKVGYGNMSMAGASSAYLAPLQEEALIEGGLDRDQIAAVIRRNIGQVIYCYEKGLQIKPSLTGRVAVRFIISPKGRVSLAKVANSSLKSQKVEGCIVGKLRGWKFPKPVGSVNVKVVYPFVLRRVSKG